jgi:hypothetical protein
MRQQWRARLVYTSVFAGCTMAFISSPDTPSLDRIMGSATLGCMVALAIVTIGVPGDDVGSGALAQDLLAGTSTPALMGGAIGGVLAVALPATLLSLALAARVGAHATLGQWSIALAMLALAAIAQASFISALGTMLAGRNASLFAVIGAFLGFLPPSAVHFQDQPPAVNSALQALWQTLPLPHHVVSAAKALESGGPVLQHVLVLAGGAVVSIVLGTGVLQWRAATGRWT